MMPLAADLGWRCQGLSWRLRSCPFPTKSNVAWRQLFTSRAENPKKLTWNWRSVSSLRTPTAWFWSSAVCTIGHELTHGFDDEGSQFDAKGNLKDWWTKEDREKFDARTKCVDDQYSSYIAVEDVHVNGKLTLGENVADLGGEILAYMAWKDATKDKHLQPVDGLTPEQR